MRRTLFTQAPALVSRGMRIDCPSCAAAYDVPADRLVAGRAVKCARCGTLWTPPAPEAPAAEAAPPSVAEVPPPPAPESAVPPTVPMAAPDAAIVPAAGPGAAIDRPMPAPIAANPPPRPSPEPGRASAAPLVAAWLLSIAALAVLGWVAVDRRNEIMAAWPPSTRAYAAIGLAARH
jgi:predicted Zn finger-like uncharacterized protein